MANINIEFDGKIYSVDENKLAPLASPLERALIQQLAGTGAVIRLGNTNYNVDANKLASARNVLTGHFSAIAGTDSKVTVNNTEYGLNKAKLQGATDKMHETLDRLKFVYDGPAPGLYETGSNYTVLLKTWDELISEHTFSVVNNSLGRAVIPSVELPEMNEYGFYYGVFYKASEDWEDTSYPEYYRYFMFYEDGTADCWDGDDERGQKREVNYTYGKAEVMLWDGYKQVCSFSEDGLFMESEGMSSDFDGTYSCGPFGALQISGDLVLPIDGSITKIEQVFDLYNDTLTGIIIPDSVTSIDDFAFYNCVSLTSITIPDSVISLGKDMFEGCTGLVSVTIGNGITSIDERGMFYGCTSLTSITIGNSITSIHSQAFEELYDVHIYIDKPKGSIPGAPWVLWYGSGTIHWSDETEEYHVSVDV